MISWLKKMFGIQSVDFGQLMREGAQLVDVRSKEEYRQGHIKGAMNIALPALPGSLRKLDSGKPVITCCASGMRSAKAREILRAHGFSRVYNGGGWKNLRHKIGSGHVG